jgi:hypothetical protein
MQSTCQSPKATPKYHANCPCNLLTPRAALMPPCSEPSPPLSWGVYFPAIAHSQYNSVAALQSVWLCSILYLRCQGPEIFLTRVFGNHLSAVLLFQCLFMESLPLDLSSYDWAESNGTETKCGWCFPISWLWRFVQGHECDPNQSIRP